MAVSTTILTMAFKTADEKARSISISPVSAAINETKVRALGAAMIDSEAFVWMPVELVGASLQQRVTAALF